METITYRHQLIRLQVLLILNDLNDMWNTFKKLFQTNDIHKVKNQYTSEMLRIHAKAKIQVRQSERMVTMIENSTAYKIARATGRLK